MLSRLLLVFGGYVVSRVQRLSRRWLRVRCISLRFVIVGVRESPLNSSLVTFYTIASRYTPPGRCLSVCAASAEFRRC